MPTVLVPIANGSEEIEAVTIIDVLRRAGVEVTVAGLEPGLITASRGVVIHPETGLARVHVADFDMIILPGGGPGTEELRKNRLLKAIMSCVYEKGGMLAAICAAPQVLADHGYLDGRKATWYPGIKIDRPGLKRLEDKVVVDDRIVTSQGPGTAMAFALKIVEILCGEGKAKEVAKGLLAS
jgi:4-methyl-5(b-hydroxyethyl)-thiazole monophosphate biosynthesis